MPYFLQDMIIRKPEEIEPVLAEYYGNLAQFMVNLVKIPDEAIILEPGCGDGALTVHLLGLLPGSVVICYDLFGGVTLIVISPIVITCKPRHISTKVFPQGNQDERKGG
jgi:hypothetical protein